MAYFDTDTLADQVVLIGLATRPQVHQARSEADDGSPEALCRVLMRKGLLTSWQLERLVKGDPTGFFYGGCKVLFHIAEGTFARVYRGVKMPGGQSVAIKVLRKRFTTDQDSIKSFYQEAEAGQKLNHPNIVRIYDFGEEDKNYFMIMEYVEGMNLRNFLRLRHRLKAEESLHLMIQLASALKYSLELGITHRDIKATNVLISNSGDAKLVDFGLATIEGQEKKQQKAHGVRTVDYSALERTCGSPKGDPRSDIFFLGCVFYQMLTGTPPMPEVEASDPLVKMLRRNINAIKPISEHSHAPPEGLCQIIQKMMRVDLKKRYQSMEEVLTDLQAYESSLAVPEPVAVVRRPVEDEAEDSDDDFPIEANGLSVLCVEIQEPIQNAFRKTLGTMGYRVVAVRHAENAPERFRDVAPDLLIFDADGQGADAIDSLLQIHEFAQEHKQELSALVLLGPRQALLKQRIPPDDRVVVLVKPIRMKDIQDALVNLSPTS